LEYDYPGNVRELENLIRRAVILCSGDRIGAEHLPPEMGYAARPSQRAAVDLELENFRIAKARAVEAFEREYLTNILRMAGGIVSRASARSGLSERNFHEKLKRYRINARIFRKSA
jgi:DNA-binding NtrC family response regulator